ncbi:MAG: cbb3-type cytochrome c oxidase N-terminal domain-containing protein [Phycisphaeraceae bacterium]
MSEQQPNNTEDHAQADEFGQLTGHNYDGIQEYDNPTPAWWTWVFIASVFFAACYLFLMLVAAGDLSPEAEYERAAVANLKKKFGEIGILEADAPTLVKYMNEPQWLQLGEGVYRANCVTCHGLNAEGNSGPNLTDDAYIHIKNIEDIGTILKEGAKAGAMPAWANRLHPNELVLVSSYVASLRGTNATGGKAAEGDVPAPWPTDVAPIETPEEQVEPEASL